MPKPRGNWKVRDCADSVEDVMDTFTKQAMTTQTGLVDLLVALRHYAYRYHLDFERALSSSEMHANVEQVPTFSEGKEFS